MGDSVLPRWQFGSRIVRGAIFLKEGKQMLDICSAEAEYSAVWAINVLYCHVSTLFKKGGLQNG